MFIGFTALEGARHFKYQAVNSSGEPTAATGSPAYRVYAPGNETPLKTGTMSLFDAANTTGYYSASFTADAASGFAVGTDYEIRITATVSASAKVAERTFTVI
jgi:hypothetical protein